MIQERKRVPQNKAEGAGSHPMELNPADCATSYRPFQWLGVLCVVPTGSGAGLLLGGLMNTLNGWISPG